MPEQIVSLSDFKARASQMLEGMEESGKPIVLTQHGAAKAVVQDYESFSRMQDAMLMLKLMVQGEADVRGGNLTAQDKVFASLRKRLKRRGG
tara:strand:+ start:249 stop:524 length:276 start_codon:yes stop_codon:yes gene_type:complete